LFVFSKRFCVISQAGCVIWVVLLAQWITQRSERKKVAQVYTRTALSAILRDQF